MLTSCRIERIGYRLRFFHTSFTGFDALRYIATFREHLDPEQKKIMENQQEFVRAVNRITGKFMENTACLQSIRKAYTSEDLSSILESVICKHAENAGIDPVILKDLARFIRKCAARDRMNELGFHQDVTNIHQDNNTRYGNFLGPTPSFLDRKYHGKKEERAVASDRFRSIDEFKTNILRE